MALTTWTYPPTQSIAGSTKISDVDNKLTLGLGDLTAWVNSTTPYIGTGLAYDYISNITTWNTQVQDEIAAIGATYYTKALLDAGQLDNRYFTETECNTNFQVKGTYDITTTNSGATVIDDIVVTDGAVSSVTSRALTLSNFGITATAAQINILNSANGLVPMATVVPIASNLLGSHPIPSSGAVDSGGWMYCNGAAIPAGHTVSGTTPNLTDGRFLRGSTSAGAIGGADTFTLTSANLAAHTHTNSSHTHTTPSHTHTTPNHSHTASSNSTGAHTHSGNVGTGGYSFEHHQSNSRMPCTSWASSSGSAGTHSHTITVNSGGASNTGSSGGTTGFSGAASTGSTGSTSAVTHLPKYVNIVYLIKVS